MEILTEKKYCRREKNRNTKYISKKKKRNNNKKLFILVRKMEFKAVRRDVKETK